MQYTIEKFSREPAYLQLYRQIREDIVRGSYPRGTRLPSKRTIAEELDLSIITAEHSYALLCEEGYVEARERSGYYVIFQTGDAFMRPSADARASREDRGAHGADFAPAQDSAAQDSAAQDSIAQDSATQNSAAHNSTAAPSAASGSESYISPEFPFSVLTRTMRGVINDLGESILDRSPNSGCDRLRDAISRYLARSRGISAGSGQIVIGAGAEYLYSLIVQLFGRDRIYGIESPSYQKIWQVYRAADVTCEMLPLGSDGIESSALWASRADILHISPYRSFPSGVSASASRRHEYIRWAARGGRCIVEDDFESEFSILKKPEETLFSLTSDDNVVYMNTFSQTISPSLRVGYMVLPQHLVPVFERKLGFYSCTVPTYIQYVLARLIEDGDFERHINRVRRKRRKMSLT